MSYINIHQVQQTEIEAVVDREPDESAIDGEEISACVEILDRLDSLPEGQALVIWRDIF